MFVVRQDQARKIVRFASGVSGRELLDTVLVHEHLAWVELKAIKESL